VIGNVALNILTPDDWMILARFEELCDVLSPRINSVKPLLAEYTGEVSLNSCDSGRGEVVAEDPKR
jgi:hypothetical protein